MEICLKNIGIVKDSCITIDGLTVIAGKNNSGKTTVGKVVYSLIDAVSNIREKVNSDRNSYIRKQLGDVESALRLFSLTQRPFLPSDERSIPKNSALFQLFRGSFSRYKNDMEPYAHDLYNELLSFDCNSIKLSKEVARFTRIVGELDNEQVSIQAAIEQEITTAIHILDDLFENLKKDPELIQYSKESIEQTLLAEFNLQIQPVRHPEALSKIFFQNNDVNCFSMTIRDNHIESDHRPIFFSSPFKKAFLIDDPFVLDKASVYQNRARRDDTSDIETVFDMDHLLTHSQKLQRTLRSKPKASILEMTLLADSLQSVRNKIDSILPGQFEFSSDGDYYVNDGKKLHVSNLATGSKMFSILKVLLEKGELSSDTMLVLDEPEAHLHPQWQNAFAEIIVMLAKELGVNILLTTHSSNFMLALDAYMRKYDFASKTNFYQTSLLDDNFVEYKCVNNDMGEIYGDFLQYLSEVKALRDSYLYGTGE